METCQQLNQQLLTHMVLHACLEFYILVIAVNQKRGVCYSLTFYLLCMCISYCMPECLCVCFACMDSYAPRACLRTLCRSQFSPSILWIPGIAQRPAGLLASTFIYLLSHHDGPVISQGLRVPVGWALSQINYTV